MNVGIAGAIQDAAAQVAQVRVELHRADAMEIAGITERDRAALVKASAYVWLAATLERFVKTTVASVLDELNRLTIRRELLRPTLLALERTGLLESYRASAKLKRFQKACEIMLTVTDQSPASFVKELAPLDGKTLRVSHFEVLWLVFGFPGPSLPSARHRLAIEDLATGRNDVAHGNIDPVRFGRSKAISDVRQLAEQVEDILLNATKAADQYLTQAGYLR